MSIKITVSKHWEIEKDAAYHVECSCEVAKANEIPKVVGELSGCLNQKPMKYQGRIKENYKIGPGHPPRRTIDFNAPATKAQMKLLKELAEKQIGVPDEIAIMSYLKNVFAVSDLVEITKGMASQFLSSDGTK